MVGTPSLTLSFAAGFVSFVSPCVLPLVPGYLATVCGHETGGDRARLSLGVLARSLVFVASFSSVFILLGLTATAIGAFLFRTRGTLNTAAGIAIAVMGALFVASVFLPAVNRQWRPPGLIQAAGRGGPLIAGVAFALAWTPCIGPTLGAIFGLAAVSSSTSHAAALFVAYSAGLAVPFVACAIAFARMQRGLAWFRRHHGHVQVVSGLLLIAVGVLVLDDQLFRLNIEIQRAMDKLGLNFFQSV